MKTEKVVDHIVNWLRDYAVNAKMNGFVIGISGGIDSAVTAAIAASTRLLADRASTTEQFDSSCQPSSFSTFAYGASILGCEVGRQ